MKFHHKKDGLALAVVLTLLSGPYVSAAEQEAAAAKGDSFNLPGILVEAEAVKPLPGGFVVRKGSTGLLGQKDVMNLPFSQTNITRKTMDAFGGPNQPLDSALTGAPGIRAAGSILHNDFTIRGFRANGTSMYVNGVHGMLTQFNATMVPFERAEVIAGPNSGIFGSGVQYESSPAGGIVNLVSKKAEDKDILSYRQTFSGKGSFGEYVDIGHRFGKEKAWGLRVNAELLNGETSVDETLQKNKGIYLNLDHRDDHSKTNLFGGYRDSEVVNGMRWFKIGPKLDSFPGAPKGSRNYSFDGMVKGAYGYFMVLNHEQYLTKDWKLFFNGGINRNKLNKNIMGQYSAYTLLNDQGDYALNYQTSATPQKAFYAQFGSTNKFHTGEVKHELTLAVDKAWRNRYGSLPVAYRNGSFGNVGEANVFNGYLHQTGAPDGTYTTYLNNKTSIWGASAVDSLEFGKWGAVLGVHKHEGQSRSFNSKTAKQSSSVKSDATCPTYALTYKPNDNILLYGSHSEQFDLGSVAGSAYANAGEIMPPSKTKQNEVGVKYRNKGLLTTLALYDIRQANNIDVIEGGKQYLRQDGEERHRGIELGVNGKIAKKWNVFAALTYMKATYENTAKAKAGKLDKAKGQVSGQPRWTGTLGLEYQADDKFSVLGRVNYTGASPVYNSDTTKHFFAPRSTVVDLGVNWKSKVGKVPVKYSLMCYNLLNKDYWMVSRGDNIYVGLPRTIYAAAEFKL